MGHQLFKGKGWIKISAIAVIISLAAIIGILSFRYFSATAERAARYLKKGEKHLNQKEYPEAAQALNKSIRINPDDPEGYILLSDAYIGMRDYTSAANALEKAVLVTEQNSLKEGTEDKELTYEAAKLGDLLTDKQLESTYIKLAHSYDLAGNKIKMVQALMQGYNITGSDTLHSFLQEYYPLPAEAVVKEGEYDLVNGEYVVDRVLSVFLSGEGTIYYTLDGSEPTKSSYIFQDYIHLRPGNHSLKAVVWNAYDLPSEVSVFSFSVKELDYLARGKERLEKLDYEGALSDFSEAIDRNEKESDAYLGLASVYLNKEMFDSAEQVLRQGLSYGDNEELKVVLEELKPEVESSLESGAYISEDKINVTLSGGTIIYYTTDGSIPDKDSPQYERPLVLKKGENIITAVAMGSYGTLGEVKTFKYTVHYEEEKVEKPAGGSEKSAASSENSEEVDQAAVEPGQPASSGEEAANEKDSSEVTVKSVLDDEGNIIWCDENLEAAVKKSMGLDKSSKVSAKAAESYKGSLDLSNAAVNSLEDLIWFKNLTVLTCKGEVLKDAELINSLKLDRVIAVYDDLNEVKAAKNYEVLKNIDHFGLCLSDFSLGDMSIIQMFDFVGTMSRMTEGLKNLEYLDLSNNNLRNIDVLGQFSSVKNIQYLILSNNKVEDILILAGFPNLIYLDVTGNPIRDFSPVKHVSTIIGKQD